MKGKYNFYTIDIMEKETIPVFFAIDDNYIPCLGVAIKSLIENASKDYNYKIIVIHTGFAKDETDDLKEMETDNIQISFFNISRITDRFSDAMKVRLRDYYSIAIYYRMFIPYLFRKYKKGIYIDSDIVLVDDISKFYNVDLGDNLLGAIPDGVVNFGGDFFKDYVKAHLGIEPEKYFNSGVLLMNLEGLRNEKIEEKFIYLLTKYNMETVAPDQDYLNLLCKDRVTYLPIGWDKMPDFGEMVHGDDLHLIHYNMFRKPWFYKDLPYSEEFWYYAKQTKYYDTLQESLNNFTKEDDEKNQAGGKALADYCIEICSHETKFKDVIDEANNVSTKEIEELLS